MRLNLLIFLLLACGTEARCQENVNKSLDSLIGTYTRLAGENPDSIAPLADSLLKLTGEKKMWARHADLYITKGKIERIRGNYDIALKQFIKSFKLFESLKNSKGQVSALTNIATVQIDLNKLDLAEFYLKKALSMTDTSDLASTKYIYSNLGVVYSDQGKEKEAIESYMKTIPIMIRQGDNYAAGIMYHNIAVSYGKMGDFKTSEKYELIALDYQKKCNNKEMLALISISLGSLIMETGQGIEKAEKYLKTGGEAARQTNSVYLLDGYLQNMYLLSKEKKDYKSATGYLEELLSLKDTIHRREKVTEATRSEAAFKNNLMQKELELVKAEKEASDATIEKNKLRNRIYVGVIIITVLLSVLLYRNFRLKKKANQLLESEKQLTDMKNKLLIEKNKQLESENIIAQYKTLREQVNPHFLFNSLNTLAALIKVNSNRSLEFVNMFSKLFRNMLEIKDRQLITLSEELGHVNTYLYLQKMRFDENLIFNSKIEAGHLNDFIAPFSMQMVIENAIKHNIITEDKPLVIDAFTENGYLVIRNNLQKRSVMVESTHTGLANIKSRYKYLCEEQPDFYIENNHYIARIPLISEHD